MLTGTWKSDDAPKVTFELPESGFFIQGSGLPDLFYDRQPARSTIIVANGRSKGPGTQIGRVLSGTLRIFDPRYPWAADPRHITLAFGCAHVTRLGEPTTYSPPREWTSFQVRDMPDDPQGIDHICDRLRDMDFRYDDTPNVNPEQSSTSEGRCCQALWAGSLAAALTIDQDRVRQAAEEFTDFQMLRRHIVCYDETGAPLAAAGEPWWRAGANGWDGEVKATFVTEASPYKFEAITQHLAFDRFYELAVGFSDFAAKLYTTCYTEAVYTRPQFRDGKSGNQQREAGYCAQLDALDKLSGWQTPERAMLGERMLEGFRAACGHAQPSNEPYAGFSPAKTGTWSHGWPSRDQWDFYASSMKLFLPGPGQDPAYPLGLDPPLPGGTCDHLLPWLQGQAVARGLKPDAFTFSKVGLWQPTVIVWMLGPVLNGLCDLADCGLPPDGIADDIRHVAACVVGPGSKQGGIDPGGNVVVPNPILDAYQSRDPRWVMPGPGKNGSVRWLVNGLIRASRSSGGNLGQECMELAKLIYFGTDYPDADAPANLETMGVLPIAEWGPK